MNIFSKIFLLSGFIFGSLILPVYTVSGQAPNTAISFDRDKAKKEIAAQSDIMVEALAKSDSLGVANLYTHDAKIFNHAMPTTSGRAEIISFYGGMIRGGITKFSYETQDVWGSDNDQVVEEGSVTFAMTNGKVVVKGKYILVWKREDGKLKILRDSFTADPNSKN